MSGPKHARYEVVSNAEVRRRAREAARQTAEELARRVAALEAAIELENADLVFHVDGIDLDSAGRAEIEGWTAAASMAVQA
ncbi:MAG: hypothetical protein ACRD12_00115, partial [Acidimicrobiales bacterium]